MVGAKRRERPSTPAVAHDGQHDDDRIGAREMLRLARRAVAAPAGFDDVGRRAAIRAEAVARMPADERLGLGERRQMLGADQALHRDAAQIGDFQIVARFEPFHRFRIETETEARRAVEQPEENTLARRAERAGLAGREQRVAVLANCLENDQLAADDIDAGPRMLAEFLQRGGVVAQRRRHGRAGSLCSRAVAADRDRGGRARRSGAIGGKRHHSAASRNGRGYIVSCSSGRCHCGPSTPCLAAQLSDDPTSSRVERR